MELQDIYNFLNDEKFSSKLTSIYLDDNSIMFEDVVTDCYLYLQENKFKLDEQVIRKFLKEYAKTKINNKSFTLMDNFKSKSLDLKLKQEKKIDERNIKKFSKLNLTEEEILCILYLRNNLSIKKYNYDFVLRKDSSGIDKSKLNVYYENIIKKLLNYITKEDK